MINTSMIDITDDYANPTFDFDHFNRLRRAVALWLLVVFVVGTPANALVVYCASKLCKSKRAAWLYQYFVLSMSFADLLFVSVVASTLFCDYFLGWTYGRFACTAVYIISHCSSVASSLSLLCLNLDKFVAIFRPLHHSFLITRRRVLAAVVVCWTLSLGWSTFFVFGPALTYEEPCALNVASFGYYLVFTIGFFVMPTLIAAVFGCVIAIIAYRNEKQQLHFRFSEGDDVGRRYTASINGSHLTSSRIRTFTFVFATTAWSCLTYLPYRVMYPIYISSSYQSWHLPVGFVFFGMMAANPLGNPFITIFTQKRYRIMIKKIWKKNILCGGIRKLEEMCKRRNEEDCATTMIGLTSFTRNATNGNLDIYGL